MQDQSAILDKLKTYTNTPYGILSLYLSFDEVRSPSEDEFDSQLRSLINTLPQYQQDHFKEDFSKIARYLQEDYKRSNTRSIAFFSAGRNLWEVLEFEFSLRPSVLVANMTNLKPIIDKLPNYTRYMVLLVDRKQAKAFTVYLGKIEEKIDLHSDETVPQKVKAEKHDSITGREDKIFRNIEDSLHRYLKDVTKQAFSFFNKQGDIDFILLAGHKEMFAKVYDLLPKTMANIVKDGFVTELNIPLNKIVLHSKEIAKKYTARTALL